MACGEGREFHRHPHPHPSTSFSITLGRVRSLGLLPSFGWVRSLFVSLPSPFILTIDIILKTVVILLRDVRYKNVLADCLKLLTSPDILYGFRLAYRFLHNNLIDLDDIGLFRKLAVETPIVTLHGVVGSVDRLNANSILLADVPRIEDRYPLLVDEIMPKLLPNHKFLLKNRLIINMFNEASHKGDAVLQHLIPNTRQK